MEGLKFESVETRIGPAVVITVIMTEETPSGDVRKPADIMIPNRFLDQCEKKLPCILYYDGVKNLPGGKRFHDLKFISPDDPRIFSKDKKEPSTPPMMKKRKLATTSGASAATTSTAVALTEESQGDTLVIDSDVGDSGDDDDVGDGVKDKKDVCVDCDQTRANCMGYCEVCGAHQPLNGGQCRCLRLFDN
jgi:hypothetical protein